VGSNPLRYATTHFLILTFDFSFTGKRFSGLRLSKPCRLPGTFNLPAIINTLAGHAGLGIFYVCVADFSLRSK
jgi:hypothetical protein